MNADMVKRLVLKDWYLQRWFIGLGLAGGVVSLGLIATATPAGFYAGSILILTILIGVGAQLSIGGVVGERKSQTLPFVMSLPISARDYTAGKMLASLLIFLALWVPLVAGTLAVILVSPDLPDGVVPFAVIVLAEIFVSSTLLAGVALVSESEAWTVGTMVAGNLFINGFIFAVARPLGRNGAFESPTMAWTGPAMVMVAVEFALIGVIVGLTFHFQSRKTHFI